MTNTLKKDKRELKTISTLLILLCITGSIPSLSFANKTSNRAIKFVLGKPLPKWKPGYLDIYHINEGAGNATFMIFPDSTTLLYDIGDASTGYNKPVPLAIYASVQPNSSEPAYVWVAKFIKKFSPHPDLLNYAVLSHFHFDHFGEWRQNEATNPAGKYKLTGITGLASLILIQTLIDRSYPHYNYHGDFQGKLSQYLGKNTNHYAHLIALTMQNYKRFLDHQLKHQYLKVEKFDVGSDAQIHLIYHPYKNFIIHNIIGNGYVWNSKDKNNYHFIQHAQNDQGNVKKENDLSIGFRIDDGCFRYFTGGDITGRALSGEDISTSAEAVSAPVIGKVDVATMNHHGFNDAQSNIFIATLRPQVWIQQNWAASQTSLPMLLRTRSQQLYNYPRDLFSLVRFQLDALSIPVLGEPNQHDTLDQYYKNTNGDIVVRVSPGGKKFWVIVLDTKTTLTKAVYGPYTSIPK